jgi:hypothetical protein
MACANLAWGSAFQHRVCVEYFWALHEQYPEPEEMLHAAVWNALMDRDIGILEYLLSRSCPWDPEKAPHKFREDPLSWAEWRDTFEIVLKYTPPGSSLCSFIVTKAAADGQDDFLARVAEYGHHP